MRVVFSSLSVGYFRCPKRNFLTTFINQIYPQLVGKIISKGNSGYSKVVFAPPYVIKSALSQNPLMARFWNFGFWKYSVTSIQIKKNHLWWHMGMFVLKMMKAMRVAKGTRQIDEIHERVLTCMQIVGGKVQEENTWAKFDGVSCFRSWKQLSGAVWSIWRTSLPSRREPERRWKRNKMRGIFDCNFRYDI